MAGITDEGWESKALTDIQDEINQALWDSISPTLNLSETSLLGQFVGITASHLRQLWEAGEALYASMDPDQAEGDALNARSRLTGTKRQAATPSTALMTLTLTSTGGSPAGTYAADTLRVAVNGNPEIVFSNDEDIEVAVTGTVTNQPFTCETEGAIAVNANTLTQIVNPITGFSNPTNPLAATTGTDEETDAELRLRRRQSLSRRGSSTVDAIRADLLAVDGVTSCTVTENTTTHSVAAYVVGGTDADVAEALWATKPAGIETTGTTTETVADSQGVEHDVKFTRPTEVRLYCAVTVTALAGVYPASEYRTVEIAVHNSAIIAGMADLAELDVSSTGGLWGVGEDIIINKVRAAIMRMPGIVDITSLTVDTIDPPVNTANITMALNQYGDFDVGDIDVTVNYVSGAP